jgi:hypothetical protein
MKESVAFPQDANVIKQHVCSEKTCITCFQNRGCMYEQYLFVATDNIEESHLPKQNEGHSSSINKRA